jgi:fructose 1,6-bisphosphate aldolase/phosphatase
VAATSTQRLSLIAGSYVGKDDPVMILRYQSGLPAVGRRWSRSRSPTPSPGACAAPTTRRCCRSQGQAHPSRMDYLRRHGPFEPHRLPLDEMESTAMPQVAALRIPAPWRVSCPCSGRLNQESSLLVVGERLPR